MPHYLPQPGSHSARPGRQACRQFTLKSTLGGAWICAKQPIGRPRLSTAHRISDTIRRAALNVKDWIYLAQDRNNWSKISSSARKAEKRGRRPALQPPPAPTSAQQSLSQRQHRPATRSTTQMRTCTVCGCRLRVYPIDIESIAPALL